MAVDKRTVLILRIVAAIVTTVSLVIFPPWHAAWAWLRPLPDTVAEQVRMSVEHDVDGVIVYVDRPGAEPETYAAGWKDRADRVPAEPTALFKIASISKLYVAATVADVVNDGMLSLDDTVASRLPELADRIQHSDRITVRMLVQHRSGIPDYVRTEGFRWNQLTHEEKLTLALEQPPAFEPDEDHGYSNTNFLLLGVILDDVLGYSHRQYVRERFLDPLELRHTFHHVRDADIERMAGGYHYEVEDNLATFGINGPDRKSPGGSMVATASDVGVFLRALRDGTLLDDKAQSIYTSIYEYEHGGWVPGYQSTAGYHEDYRCGRSPVRELNRRAIGDGDARRLQPHRENPARAIAA